MSACEQNTSTAIVSSLIDVVIVAWNHGDTLRACLDSLGAAARDAFDFDRVVIVDNASDPPVRIAPAEGEPAVTTITNAANRGFAAACNQGARGSRADFVLFLNPDTRIGRDTLAAAVAHLGRPESARIGLLGLPLADERGAVQRTCGRELTARRVFNQASGLNRVWPAFCPGIRLSDWDHQSTRQVDFASGASLLVRRSVFDELQGFDPRFVVFLEDADLAERARLAGWDTWFLRCDPVLHRDGWSTGRERPWRLARSWQSLWRYGRKHFSWPGVAAAGATVTVVAPLTRLLRAVVCLSWRDGVDTCAGYVIFWRLLLGWTDSLRTRAATARTSLPPA